MHPPPSPARLPPSPSDLLGIDFSASGPGCLSHPSSIGSIGGALGGCQGHMWVWGKATEAHSHGRALAHQRAETELVPNAMGPSWALSFPVRLLFT